MCSGLVSLPEWLGLRLLGLYRVRRASWSAVTPDSGALWLASLGRPRSGSKGEGGGGGHNPCHVQWMSALR